MQKNKNQQTNEEDLKYVMLPRKMFKDYDVTLTTVSVYAYMLARYKFFKSLNKEYFESIEAIAENCFCSTASVKTALNFLCKNALLERGKLKGATFNKNVYVLHDKYSLFNSPSTIRVDRKETKVPHWLEDDESLPF